MTVAVLLVSYIKDSYYLACFKISGKVSDEEDKLIRSDIGLDKHFLKSLRILVETLPGSAVLYVFSVLRISSKSSFVVGDKKKSFHLNILSVSRKI